MKFFNEKHVSNVIPLRAKPVAGYYLVANSIAITLYEKPKWVHRLMCKIAFGWVWLDL